MPYMRIPAEHRFFARVYITDRCWFWRGARREKGYGLLRDDDQRLISAHRFMWEQVHGRKLGPDEHILHACDTPNCVRPDHLFVGSNADNVRDRVAKKRGLPRLMPLALVLALGACGQVHPEPASRIIGPVVTDSPAPFATPSVSPETPSPAPTPGPTEVAGHTEASRGVSGDPAAVIGRRFGPHAGKALRVARCESGFDPRAVGRAGERGIFQIHPIHWRGPKGLVRLMGIDPAALFDPVVNTEVAYKLSRGGTDWSAWTCG